MMTVIFFKGNTNGQFSKNNVFRLITNLDNMCFYTKTILEQFIFEESMFLRLKIAGRRPINHRPFFFHPGHKLVSHFPPHLLFYLMTHHHHHHNNHCY